ncbi:MAG: CaiB/BaiF CoA-transferase family protein [Pseudomonadota bacterium]
MHTGQDAASGAARALDGVKVLDLSRVLAGPWCAQTLGDLGADVIKVEAPGQGDDTRAWGPPFLAEEGETLSGQSAYFLCANRNKRSIAIDFSRPAGADLVRRLARGSHIVIENYKVGGLAKYGLDYASLSAEKPSLVYCSVTGFGQFGPYAERGGYDFVAQGMGGLMSITGQPNGEPTKVGVALCDLFTGVYATTAVLAALRHAERTGEGQHIDCALLDTQIAMLANQGMSYLVGGVVGGLMGNAHPTVVPYRAFRASDGELIVAVGNDGQFRTLCEAIGQPAWAQDPRFRRNAARVANRQVLEQMLCEIFATLPVGATTERLAAAGVPCGPVNSIDKVFADAHVETREIVRHIPRTHGNPVPTVSYPPRLSRTPADYRSPPPRLGENTAQVLEEELGLDAGACARLRETGVIGGA